VSGTEVTQNREQQLSVADVRRRLGLFPLGGSIDPLFDGARISAVLVALADGRRGAEVLLTRRSMTVGTHQGQVSFPGGRVDDGESVLVAAIREAHEEVGLAPDVPAPFAELSHLNTRVSMSYIVPIVAQVSAGLDLVPQSGEVDRVFWVPLGDFEAPGVHRSELWYEGETPRQIHFYDVADEDVWGATGAILYELLGILYPRN
jgi:8-oxo-dGTP pyrophosphatase MutT (NUDIX family)